MRLSDLPPATRLKAMRRRVEDYYDACNRADRAALEASFTPDAVHYFPANDKYGPWKGAAVIAEAWIRTVEHTAAFWAVDRFVGDPDQYEAVAEWTQFRPRQGKRLRGDEWYVFDADTGLIKEVRAYFAAVEHPGQAVHELGGFDYLGRNYAINPPEGRD